MTRAAGIERHARWLLLVLYIVLLGGAFSLDRISSTLPAVDLRWVGMFAVLVAAAAWSAGVAQRRVGRRRLGVGPVLVLAWCGWAVTTAAWAPADARVAAKVTDLVLMAGLLAVTFTILRRCSPDVTAALWPWVFWTAVIYLVAALAAGPGDQGRYAAFGGGPNVFVRVMVLGVVAAAYLAVKRRRSFAVGIPFFVVGAILSGSRGGLLALVVVALPLGVLVVRRVPRRTLIRGVAVLVGLVAAAPLYASDVLDLVRRRFIEQTFESGYDSGRSGIFTDSWHIGTEHAGIGAGLDSYYALVGRLRGFEYPHNIVLESFADGGIVGLALIVAAVVSMVVRAWRPRGSLSPETLAALAASALLLIASMTSGSYYDSRFLWFFLAVAVASSRGRSDHRPARPVTATRWAASGR